MSELREECYKCLNNQSCPGAADYGSILCMTKRKYKMSRNEEDSIYAHKFAVMQQQIDEKEKRIKELEQENRIQRRQLNSAFDRGWIPKEKVKEIVKEAIEIIESEQFKIIMGDMTKVGRLRWLLEEELLEEK